MRTANQYSLCTTNYHLAHVTIKHKEKVVNKQGFTLLEVSLFFAVSGLLALVAFAGLGPRLRNVRFTDAVRTLESTVQRQLSDFQAGINLRDNSFECTRYGNAVSVRVSTPGQAPGGAADCIINGRLAVFEQGQVVFYPVVSLRKALDGCIEDAVYGKIFCHSPHIMGYEATKQVAEYRNGAARISPDEMKVLYIQDPQGTSTKLTQYTSAISPEDMRAIGQSSVGSLPVGVCLGLSGRTAQFTYTNNSLKPEVHFEGCA